MQFNTIGLTVVAFLSYMIMSGLMTQTGIIMAPFAEYLHISLITAASMFSLLTGGTFAGTFASMILYERYSIQQILKYNYAIFLLFLLLILTLDIRIQWFISLFLFCLGMGCGIGLAGGAIIISKIFREKKRASAFLATDCAFSLAGYLFPTAATFIIANNMSWTVSYASVGLLVALVIIGTYCLTFPKDQTIAVNTTISHQSNQRGPPRIWTTRVFIMALALCCYLITQTTFLTWAPTYLQHTLHLAPSEANQAIAHYWGPSIFGLLTATVLINKIPVRPLLLVVSVCAVLISFVLFTTDDPQWFLTVTLALGFMTSCIFKLGISVGTEQVNDSPPLLVTFLLCSATVGSTIAPVMSALMVSHFGVASAMVMTMVGFSLVLLLFIFCMMIEKKQKVLVQAH